MKTFYTILIAILLPKLLCSATSSYNVHNNECYDAIVVKTPSLIDPNESIISLPEIVCPQRIDTILPSRRDCEAVIDYNVQFNTNNCPVSQFNLSQNFSDDNITAFSCNGDVETSYLRVFDLNQSGLPAQIFLTSVDVGVGFASSEPEITVNIYRLEGEFIYANLTLLQSLKAIVPIISSDIFTIPSNVLVSNTDMIVVELVAPPFDVGQIPGFNIGGGQSAPSFIASPGCNILEPIDIASFGQPDFNLVLKLNASDFSLQQTAGLESGSSFPAGTTTNTFELSDPSGNATTCSFDVNVSFGEAPFLICPPNINANSQDSICGAIVDFDVFILETCTGDSIFQIQGIPSGGEFPPGFTRNEFVAVDIFGGRDTCRFDIFVGDVDPPVFDCLEDLIIAVDDNECGSLVDFEIIATDFCGVNRISQVGGLPSGFVFPVGVTTNRYIAFDDAGNSSECSFNIIIEDGSALTFVNCPTDITISTSTEDCGAVVNYELPEVSGGSCDSIAVNIRQNFSNTVVSSFGCDQSIESRHLRVFDMPQMGINGDFLIELMDIGIGFADDNDPQIDLNIYNIDSDEILYENMTLVFSRQYLLPTLADTTQTIIVNHLVPRGQKVVIELVVPENNTTRFIAGYSNAGEFRSSFYAAPACGFDEPVELSSIGIDLALVMQLNGSVTNNRLVEQTVGFGRGEMFPFGTTTNTFTLDDGSTCSFDVTVIDGTPPTIVCPADITMDIIGINCDTMVMVGLPIVLDNCGDFTITNDVNVMESASGIYSNGVTPVTYIATDLAGNSSTCTFNVVVNGSLAVNITSTDVSCSGGNDGEIVLEILSGMAPFSFTWSNGQATQNLNNLTADTYSITVQDGSQCTFEATVVIFEPTPLILENVLVSNSVNGQENGNINIDITGGTPPYTYNWSNGENEANITNLTPGFYSCVVTDSLGCEFITEDYEIEDIVATRILLDPIPMRIYPNPTNQILTIELESNQFEEIQYQVINTLGMIVKAGPISQLKTNISVNSYPDGLYFLQVSANKGQSSSSFIVQH